MRTAIVASLLMVSGVTQDTIAVTSNENAKIVAHLVPHHDRQFPCSNPPLPPCNSETSELNTVGELGHTYDMYVLALSVSAQEGLSAVEFSIDYNSGEGGIRIHGWQSCADSEIRFPNSHGESWPASGSGNILMFNAPRDDPKELETGQGVTAAIGCFIVTAYGTNTFEIRPHVKVSDPLHSTICMTDAQGRETALVYPDNVGTVAFGNPGGAYDPCIEGREEGMHTLSFNPPNLTVSNASPNPAHGEAPQWNIYSREDRRVAMRVYSVTGQLVRKLGSVDIPPGNTTVLWDGKSDNGVRASSGKYYLHVLGEDGYQVVRTVLLLR